MPSTSFPSERPSTDDPGHGSAPPHRAAFFGLDQTLIRGSSLLLLAQGLHARELCRHRDMARFVWERARHRFCAPSAEPQLASSAGAALGFVTGRNRHEMEALAREIAAERIVPTVYPEMARLIDQHRSAGDLTFVTTAAPAEVARVVAEGLDMTGGLGTLAAVDGSDRYSGHLEGDVLRGSAKASAVRAHADASGIDLKRSTAYSDTISDLPLLEMVGCPEVVNPDARLRVVAESRGWPVHHVGRPPGHRRSSFSVHHRVAMLPLSTPLGPERVVGGGRSHQFRCDDAALLVAELEASGRFRRDSRLGRLFHPGQTSLRELVARDSLHIIVGDDGSVSAHVDHFSPLADDQPEEGCRYSLGRIAAHNVLGMAGDLVRLVPRREPRVRCCPTPDDDFDEDGPRPSGLARTA